MNNSKKLKIFYKEIRKYFNIISKDESYFHSSKAKTLRSYLINLKSEIESELDELIGNNLLIEINSNYHVNILTGAFSEDYKKSVYCLNILFDALKNYFNASQDKVFTKNEIQELLNRGECETIEFKSSLRWDYKKNTVNKELEFVIAKTISAFMNSKGGKLLIGVEDSGEILGISGDIATFKNQNVDGFLLQLTQVINNCLGKENHHFVNVDVVEINGKQICIVDVERNPDPVYLKNMDGKEEFYIRSSASSQPLSIREANEYIRSHWLR